MTDASSLPTADELAAVIAQAEKLATEALASGDLANAKKVLSELVEIAPANPVALNGLGVIALHEGDAGRAERMLREAQAAAPDWADPHYNLGTLYFTQDRHRRALKALNKAIGLQPRNAGPFYIRALAHQRLGHRQDAEADLRAVLEIDPDHAGANNDLGCLEAQRRNLGTSIELLRRATAATAAPASYWINLGNVLLLADEVVSAKAVFETCVQAKPDSREALIGLATCQRRLGELKEALLNAQKGAALGSGDDAAAENLVGTIYRELGKFDEAASHFELALEIAPKDPSSRSNLGMLQLLRGDWREGWANYEARRHDPGFELPWGGVNYPDWDGGPLDGRTLLVLSEQGFGDSIQFARFLPELAARGGDVCFAVQPELRRLMQSLGEAVTLIEPDRTPPQIDLRVLLLSLPRVLGLTSPQEISGQPYLAAPPLPTPLAEALSSLTGVKVGINWCGAARHKEDFKRSVAPEQLAPLLATPGVSFVSWAVEAVGDSLTDGVLDISDHLTDFADTAAVMAELDVVISVDTATVHLAGAIGAPCWALIPFVPDWRWTLEGETTPWYDSVQLYRQPTLGDWNSVIERVAGDLGARVAAKR